MINRWGQSALILVGAVGLAHAGSGKSDANLQVDVNAADSDLSCPDPVACFDVWSDRNITQVFVKVCSDCEESPPYQIYVDGRLVTKLHTNGGPCNHGYDAIPRQVLFPLQGNQSYAEVCIEMRDSVPSEILVGAKSSDECVSETLYATCEPCDDCDWVKPGRDELPDPSYPQEE